MERFVQGNVVKTKNGIVIVTKVTKEHTHWISAKHNNSCGITPNEDYQFTGSQNVDPDDYSEEVTNRIVDGFNKNTLIADTVIDWIKDSCMKNFNL